MKSVVLDTNALLDLFVFNDFRAIHLKQALREKRIDAVATAKTIEELEDVISRPLFALDENKQTQILSEWQSLCRRVDDQSLTEAPWQCEDTDDQVFLNLAYSIKPAILISKDNALLKLANQALKGGILITSSYQVL
jgi:putative PIN family toxin of toxin-antitoxin system